VARRRLARQAMATARTLLFLLVTLAFAEEHNATSAHNEHNWVQDSRCASGWSQNTRCFVHNADDKDTDSDTDHSEHHAEETDDVRDRDDEDGDYRYDGRGQDDGDGDRGRGQDGGSRQGGAGGNSGGRDDRDKDEESGIGKARAGQRAQSEGGTNTENVIVVGAVAGAVVVGALTVGALVYCRPCRRTTTKGGVQATEMEVTSNRVNPLEYRARPDNTVVNAISTTVHSKPVFAEGKEFPI